VRGLNLKSKLFGPVLLAGSAVFALVYRLPFLGRLSLWMDEGFYVLAARQILRYGYPLYPSGHVLYKGILYSYLLAFVGLFFGLGEATLRAVSVVLAALTVPLLYGFARKFMPRLLAAASAGILIFSVWETEYARTAIYFSFLELVYLGGLYLFYLAYFEEKKRYRLWTLIVFILAPHASQLAMGIWFAFPALLLVRGAKRFFRKDVLWPLGLTTLSYALVQVHEMFFWKVGFVYEKVPSSLADVIRYFFTGFSLDYFAEVLRAFPRLGWVVFLGVFLFLGEAARRKAADAEAEFRRGWYFLYLSLLFPLVFFGFFRTHVQPRYLFQLRPLLIVLFLIALWRAARALAPLLLAPFWPSRDEGKASSWLAALLCAAGVFFLTDGAGWVPTRAVVNRWYKDPVKTDLMTRSGRFEHYDYRGVGEYVRTFRRPGDTVIAMHMVFQEIYAGGVDYWLWSGGPGTWDAWEMTKDGWRDVYVGARWINDLDGLRRTIDGRTGRLWLITSQSIERRDHISAEIAAFIKGQPDRLAFRGKDGMSEVYLWGDESGALTAGQHTLEGEWLSLPFGRIVYPEDATKRAAFFFDADRDAGKTGDVPFIDSVLAGLCRFRIRARIDGAAQGRILGLSLWAPKGREPLRSLLISGADFGSSGAYREFDVAVPVTASGPLRLRVVYFGGAGLTVDWLDLVPESEEAAPAPKKIP